MSRASHSRYPTFPSPRVSAWLADMEDWDVHDADVFVATLGRDGRQTSRRQAEDAENSEEASRIA